MAKENSCSTLASTAEQIARAISNPTAMVESPRLKTATGKLSVSDPGIRIEGLGAMPFPLRVRHLKQIEPFTVQVPYGKGTKTLFDKLVRNTREITPELL